MTKLTNYDIVTFDIADGSFQFYSKDGCEQHVNQLRDEQVEDGQIESDEDLDFDDILALACGDELFWDWMPGPVEQFLTSCSETRIILVLNRY